MTAKGAIALAMSVAVHGAALIAIGSAMQGRQGEPASARRESIPVLVHLVPAQATLAREVARTTVHVRENAPKAGAFPPRAARRPSAPSEGPRPVPAPPAQAAGIAPTIAPPEVHDEVVAARAGVPDPIARSSAPRKAEGSDSMPASSEMPGGAPEHAAYLHAPEPEYPPSAREDGQEGLVVVRVRVSTDGLPVEIALRRSSGFRALDRAAISAVKRWTFVPARQAGHSVESWIDVPIRFHLG